MAFNKEQVLACLEGVKSPAGVPLPKTGTLSDVVAGDGKVFFSISVDAAEVKAWEAVDSAPRRRCARCRACNLRSLH